MFIAYIHNKHVSIELYANRLVCMDWAAQTFGTDWAILQRLGYIWDRWFDGHRLINDILVFDNYRSTIEIDEIFYDLELADTAGQVDYEQVRLVSNFKI